MFAKPIKRHKYGHGFVAVEKEYYRWDGEGSKPDKRGDIQHKSVIRFHDGKRTRFRIGDIAIMNMNPGEPSYAAHVISMYEGLPVPSKDSPVPKDQVGMFVDLRWLYRFEELDVDSQRKARTLVPSIRPNERFWSDHVDSGLNQVEVLDSKVQLYQNDFEKVANGLLVRMYYDNSNKKVRRLSPQELIHLINYPTRSANYQSWQETAKERKTARKNVRGPQRKISKPPGRRIISSEDETDNDHSSTRVPSKRKAPSDPKARKEDSASKSASTMSDDDLPLAQRRGTLGRQTNRPPRQKASPTPTSKGSASYIFTPHQLRQLLKDTMSQRMALNEKEREAMKSTLVLIQKKLKQLFQVGQANGEVIDEKWLREHIERILNVTNDNVPQLFRIK